MVKPAAEGTNYSYKKTLYLNADTSPSSIINNVKFFCDGTIGWTGVDIEAKTEELGKVSQALGEKVYAAMAEKAKTEGDATSQGQAAKDDNVVDAEFKEVDKK
jgi:hypothetical protein